LFPASLSAAVSGFDASQEHAGLFLVTTALGMVRSRNEATRRSNIGGLVEHEWFSGNQTSGNAWQVLYRMNSARISCHGRYTRENDTTVHTNSGTISADFHPSFVLNSELQWRVGFDARSGFVYSRSSPRDAGAGQEPLSLGSIDYGGGIWTAVLKD